MPSTTYIAIDPGLTGGIAMYMNDKLHSFPMPICKEGNKNVVNIMKLYDILALPQFTKLVIESQNPRPGEGGVSAFTSGRNYGRLETVAQLLFSHQVSYVHPGKWYRDLDIQVVGEYDSAYKKKRARKLAVANKVEELWRDKLEQADIHLYGMRGGLLDGVSDSLAMLYWLIEKETK